MLEEQRFCVELDGFEGPLDLLLDLARAQKIDLRSISLVVLADQYLAYLEGARARSLEIAADYLVMAAWLAFLKSQLLLPALERTEPDADELAAALAGRLRALDAIRQAAAWLDGRPLLGRERLPRGVTEPLPQRSEPRWVAHLAELMRAYGIAVGRGTTAVVALPRRRLLTVEQALERLRRLTGHDWRDLVAYLPPGLLDGIERRAAIAASLVAGLELARTGAIDLEQAAPFSPVMVRRRP